MTLRSRLGVVLVLLGTLLAAPAPAYADPTPLPTDTDVDYQLGGAADVPDRVGVVVRDRTATPATGRYNVCYMAGYDGTRIGFDFAVAEECSRYDGCDRYVSSYGDQVLAIEYRKRDFRSACRQYAEELAIVLRDLALRRDGIRRWC